MHAINHFIYAKQKKKKNLLKIKTIQFYRQKRSSTTEFPKKLIASYLLML